MGATVMICAAAASFVSSLARIDELARVPARRFAIAAASNASHSQAIPFATTRFSLSAAHGPYFDAVRIQLDRR
jgi:hypothetical protein